MPRQSRYGSESHHLATRTPQSQNKQAVIELPSFILHSRRQAHTLSKMADGLSLGSVCVVGGCGFLGNHIVQEIFRADKDRTSITVVDIQVPKEQHEQATYHSVEITQRDQVERVLRSARPSVIIHTVSPNPFEKDHSVLEKVNVVGTRNVVECAEELGTVKAFIYTASSSVVHNQRQDMIQATENLPVLFRPEQPEFYSHTKALAEKIVLDANGRNGMLTASIRPAALYGEGDKAMTTNLTRTALDGKAKYHFGDGRNLFDTCYVGNCSYAHILVAKALIQASTSQGVSVPTNKRVGGEAFFVTNDEPIPFWDLPRLIADIAGCPVKKEDIRGIPRGLMMSVAFLSEWMYWLFTFGQKQPKVTRWVVRLTTMERTICIDKIKERLDYCPRFTLREGLERGVRWYLAQDAGNAGSIKED